MNHRRSITELFDASNSSDLSVVGQASREILERSSECVHYVPELVELLGHSNAAISDQAFRTIQRIGQPAFAVLKESFDESDGELRRLLMGLIAETGTHEDFLPILKFEIENGNHDCRFWAANCLGRQYNDKWPNETMELLDTAVNILFASRDQQDQWTQARITLNHLGRFSG